MGSVIALAPAATKSVEAFESAAITVVLYGLALAVQIGLLVLFIVWCRKVLTALESIGRGVHAMRQDVAQLKTEAASVSRQLQQ